MLVERSAVARTEHDHLDRHGIALVFEEQGEILRFDITELNVHQRISTKAVSCGKWRIPKRRLSAVATALPRLAFAVGNR